jgi:hypothetical protein
MGGGRGAQRPIWGVSEIKKMGARSARARTRGQNPLVEYICSLHKQSYYRQSAEGAWYYSTFGA